MKHGFIRVAVASPRIRLADCKFNGKQVMETIEKAEKQDIKLIVFPELYITGYTCGDLFFQEALLRYAKENIKQIANFTKDKEIVVIVGFPYEYQGELYNTAAVIQGGKILGLVPKVNIPSYEARYFSHGRKEAVKVNFLGQEVYFGSKQIFECINIPNYVIEVGIGEVNFASKATIMVNLSASEELIGKADYRRQFIKSSSLELTCGYIYADAGEGESTTNSVYGGHNLIAENGIILNESEPFEYKLIYSELDLVAIISERKRMVTVADHDNTGYIRIPFSLSEKDYELKAYDLSRKISTSPFIPEDTRDRDRLCKDIIMIQAMGLKGRLAHVTSKCAVIGVSGGLDSTLALLVIVKTFDKLNIPRKNILGITMPGFGTTKRTYKNALQLMKSLGVSIKEIDIKDACLLHFKNIEHDPAVLQNRWPGGNPAVYSTSGCVV